MQVLLLPGERWLPSVKSPSFPCSVYTVYCYLYCENNPLDVKAMLEIIFFNSFRQTALICLPVNLLFKQMLKKIP
jgi:hypothetical protein